MASRIPVASPFANSRNPLTLVVGSGPNPRHIALKPWMAGTLAVAGFVVMAWYLVATLYFVFRDEMLGRLISQQTEMQQAYEDRLAALRNQIDRVTSRQLVDQNSIEAKMQELLSRHAQLETRHAIVAQLAEQPALAASRNAARPAPARPAAEAPLTTGAIQSFAPLPRPQPAPDGLELRMPGPRDQSSSPAERRLNHSRLEGAPPAIVVAELRDAADRIERQQISALEGLERQVRHQAQRLSQVFAETGLDAERFTSVARSAQGGPLVPLQAGKAAGPFEQKLSQAQFAIGQTERMHRIIGALPTSRPIPEDFEQTSSFGTRSDPFTRALAMHTGIDFRAPTGAPVRAAAGGKVIEADWAGGYGNMVEIDHGNGLTTRYAHLSSIAVNEGDTVARGAIVGRVGSTGRSTGPHLHYETRIDGDPADPLRFIRAGLKLQAK